MSIRKKLGIDFGNIDSITTCEDRIQYINFKLASLGLPIYRSNDTNDAKSTYFIDLFEDIIKDYKEKTRMVDVNEVGIHKRINQFLSNYFYNSPTPPKGVEDSLTLDHYGLAREMSLPPDGNTFSNEYISSYRIKQGVLHNPRNDRRTTEGSFHIAEGGLAIPYDKKAVPKEAFVKLYQAAINPPEELKILPFTINQAQPAKTFVSLMIKPIISPKVAGVLDEKSMEVLFVAPGSLVSNLDFIESVFGNMGDPSFHNNDSGMDVDNWSGHTGYILLAPHLTTMKKVDLGLPHYNDATERQRRDGMCYQDESECYNEGNAFKLTCRDKSGVAVTLIADNYFGYSKKEIKTQISFAANLFGNVEEEHAGGTIAYPQKNLGVHYNALEDSRLSSYSFDQVIEHYGSMMYLQADHYGIDKNNKQIIYLPENIKIDLYKTEIKWLYNETIRTLKLQPNYFYVLPNGERIHMEKHPEAPIWKLIGTEAEGTFCHKPCTVSGGGKSEISKSISNSIIYGTYYVNNLAKDLDNVESILNYDYRRRWKDCPDRTRPSREILSIDRTLGSVIKLLTPSAAYTDEFNAYIEAIPNHVKALVFMVKRFYQQSWGDGWRKHFSVDLLDGKPGNELKFDNRKIRPSYLRVGFRDEQAWRIFKLRMDFMPSEKIQMEDDITASVLVPRNQLPYSNPDYTNGSLKFTTNCEYRFFQRPDDAVHKGYDKQAEKDLSSNNLFVTNYQPLTKADVEVIKNDVMGYIAYTDPVKAHIEAFLKSDYEYCVVSSEPRIVNGAPSKNPRYLEHRSDFINPLKIYLSEVGVRLSRKIPLDQPILTPVNAILAGRRNNPPGEEKGKKILPLSVYNPIHYQELPELFMDYISSLTGKSPSTTGAGSEGALTKGPFNMLLPIYDLNNALLSYVLGDYAGYTTPAGHIGSNIRVDHDISILVPEIWSRLKESERDPVRLIQEGSLEKLEDFDYQGVHVPASRLGYRMTDVFCYKYLGKIFDEPQTVFSEEILRPERQSLEAFVDGVQNIASGHKRTALNYFQDGSIEDAIPPIKAVLSIMAYGDYQGHTLESSAVRDLFKKETILSSDWYNMRLKNKQRIDINLIQKKIDNLEAFIANPINISVIKEFHYDSRLESAKETLRYYQSDAYLEALKGTIGASAISL
jgi:phosphoenolpyruvate carboxykinase (diphosphate)